MTSSAHLHTDVFTGHLAALAPSLSSDDSSSSSLLLLLGCLLCLYLPLLTHLSSPFTPLL
ncbi:hypothetical protein INR49_023204 [Caranx melampygus]|nr:hypothetical protein INR49_023204 [Caranx melampygus]